MGTEMENTADKGSDRAGVGMSTVPNNFTSIGIFLGREGERCKCGKGELCGSAVAAGKVWVPIVNVASWRRKGWLAVPEAGWVCSPGRRRKKNPRVVKSAVATVRGSALVRATTLTWLTIGKGMGLTRVGGRSIRL